MPILLGIADMSRLSVVRPLLYAGAMQPMPSMTPKVIAILCSVKDYHSNDMAAAFASCCKGAEIYLLDYTGDVYRYYANKWGPIGSCTRLLNVMQRMFPSHGSIIERLRGKKNEFFGVDPSIDKKTHRFLDSPFSASGANIAEQDISLFLKPTCLESAFANKKVLYAMPPCAFNRVPAYFLHFSNKLDFQGPIWSYSGTGKNKLSGPALELPEMDDAHRTILDIGICHHIFTRNLRFYGTCHGAQMMWLALGQPLSRNVRIKSDKEVGSLRLTNPEVRPHNFGYDGVGITTHNMLGPGGQQQIGGVRTLSGDALKSLTGNFLPFTYSTDYNHSHLMLAPDKFVAGLVCDKHEVGDTWSEYPDVYDTSQSWNKLRKRKGSIIAYFNVGNIYCFQDHPSYHVEKETIDYGKVKVANPRYEESRQILSTYIWK